MCDESLAGAGQWDSNPRVGRVSGSRSQKGKIVGDSRETLFAFMASRTSLQLRERTLKGTTRFDRFDLGVVDGGCTGIGVLEDGGADANEFAMMGRKGMDGGMPEFLPPNHKLAMIGG